MFELLSRYYKLLLVGHYPEGPLGGLAMTLLLAIICLVITFPVATAFALARISQKRWLVNLCIGFIYAVRGMPLLMLVFWIYYFLPTVLGFPLTPFLTMLIAIVIFEIAYLSEVIRAAIEALPRGQFDAAEALGLSYSRRVVHVILPQALVNCIPGIVSQFILMIKETSLGYIITFNELTYTAMELNNILLVRPVEIFAIIALTYLVICVSLSQLAAWLERVIEKQRMPQHA